jgi:alpha-glucosidase
VEAQRADPASTWSMYASALRLRRELGALGDGPLRWLSVPGDDLLVFERPGVDGATVICALNFGPTGAPVPYGVPVLASRALAEPGVLPPDTAAWWLR